MAKSKSTFLFGEILPIIAYRRFWTGAFCNLWQRAELPNSKSNHSTDRERNVDKAARDPFMKRQSNRNVTHLKRRLKFSKVPQVLFIALKDQRVLATLLSKNSYV